MTYENRNHLPPTPSVEELRRRQLEEARRVMKAFDDEKAQRGAQEAARANEIAKVTGGLTLDQIEAEIAAISAAQTQRYTHLRTSQELELLRQRKGRLAAEIDQLETKLSTVRALLETCTTEEAELLARLGQ